MLQWCLAKAADALVVIRGHSSFSYTEEKSLDLTLKSLQETKLPRNYP
jgi:hypothetical protein